MKSDNNLKSNEINIRKNSFSLFNSNYDTKLLNFRKLSN